MSGGEESIPISALEHHSYCPRQAALILVDAVWEDNAATARGEVAHRRADDPGSRRQRGVVTVRSTPLWSWRYGVHGRADVIEIHSDGSVFPVEYKSGRPHGRTAAIQLCAQALCLEEMLNLRVAEGAVFYFGLMSRQRVVFDDELRAMTIEAIGQVQALHRSRTLPPPVSDQRCDTCQLLAHCQPFVVDSPERLRAYVRDQVLSCS